MIKGKKLLEAELVLLDLINDNSENPNYFHALEKCKNLDGDLDEIKRKKLLDLYEELCKKYPKSKVIQIIPLKYATGIEFIEVITCYLVKMFRKGVPSLFKSIIFLLEEKEKALTIKNVVEDFHKRLIEENILFKDQTGICEIILEKESPPVYLWVAYFLAQMHDYYKEYKIALEFLNLAIDHSPTAVELYMMKARVYKVFKTFI